MWQFAPDQHHIVSVSDDGTLRVWGAIDGNCIQIIKLKDPHVYIYTVKISRDGKYLITERQDRFTVFELYPVFSRPIMHGKVSTNEPLTNGLMLLDEHGCIRQQRTGSTTPLTLWKVAPNDTLHVSRVSCNRVYLSSENSEVVRCGNKRNAASDNVTLCLSTSDGPAWVESIYAFKSHLSLTLHEKVNPENIVTLYRFDTLQLLNSLHGGKGLVAGKTVPVAAMELIAYCLFSKHN